MPVKKQIDALDALSSDSSSSSSSSSDNNNEEKQHQPSVHKKAKPTIALDDLKKHGYKEGSSVLLMPAQRKEAYNNWAWGTGNTRERRKEEDAEEDESADERERDRHAATTGAEEQAKYARKVIENAARIKEERRAEELRLKTERRREEKKKSGGNNNNNRENGADLKKRSGEETLL